MNELPQSPTLTKAEIARVLTEDIGLNQREANEIVNEFFEEIKDGIVADRLLKLTGFATFKVKEKKSRPGRNPKTGREAEISARRVVIFRPSRLLKCAINERD